MTPEQLDLLLDAVGLVLGSQRVIAAFPEWSWLAGTHPGRHGVVSIGANIILVDDCNAVRPTRSAAPS